MMATFKTGKVLVLALVLLLAWAVEAAPAPTPAQDLWQKVEHTLKAGRMLEACRLATGFSKYSEDPFYPKAEEGLLKYGLSIEDPLGSYTMLRMVVLQNKTEAKRIATGNLPKAGPRRKYRDAWGMPLRIELVARKGFIYVVRSAGPDRKYLTPDDMVVGVREDQTTSPLQAKVNPQATVKKDLESSALESGRRSLLGSQMRPARPPAAQAPAARSAGTGQAKALPKTHKVKDGEVEVSLDELLNK